MIQPFNQYMRWLVDNSVDNPEREKPIKKMIAKKFECNTEFGDYIYYTLLGTTFQSHFSRPPPSESLEILAYI